jgi:hypothetical protein
MSPLVLAVAGTAWPAWWRGLAVQQAVYHLSPPSAAPAPNSAREPEPVEGGPRQARTRMSSADEEVRAPQQSVPVSPMTTTVGRPRAAGGADEERPLASCWSSSCPAGMFQFSFQFATALAQPGTR